MKKLLYILLIINCSSLIVNSQSPTQEWASRYNRPPNSIASANFLDLDKFGNSYVLGQVYNPTTLSDIVLIKYNSTGDTLWTRIYNSTSNIDEFPEGFAVDSLGNTYITGYTGLNFGPYDILTLSYNPSGVLRWVKTYSTLQDDVGFDIKSDNTGNCYVTGVSNSRAITIKYNSSGDTVWTRLKSQSGHYYSGLYIELDNTGNIHTGISKVNTSTNIDMFLVVKYDLNGSEQWTAVHDNNSGFNLYAGLAVDNSGNSFIASKTLSGFTTIKFNSSGSEQWTKTYSNGLGEQVFDITTDTGGNCYVVGASTVGAANYDYITIKYNPVGDSVWVRRYNGTGNGNDEAYSIALDDSANVYITGRSNGSGTSRDYATIKYNTNGVQQWVARYNGQIGNGDDVAYAVKLDNNRNVFVTGISDRGGLLPDYVTIKYSQVLGIVNPVGNYIPDKFMLYQNYPNPFNPSTKIRFSLNKTAYVLLTIYDIKGTEIKELINSELKAGEYETDFTAENLPSGVYFYSLIIDNKLIDTKKMVYIS